ncbi:O-antigen polymerase [Tepidanaerobacter syntrophicus]|uniref:O-antigen polymerase n=1 Tax=Tepidanaerobacter syntrophicus TaxID=224999 RepID=UPI003C70156D
MIFIFMLILLYSLMIKDFLNPLCVFVSPFTCSYLTYYIYYYRIMNIDQLNKNTYILFLLGIISFVIGYCYMSIFYSSNIASRDIGNKPPRLNQKLFSTRHLKYKFLVEVFILIGLIGFCINIVQAINFALNGPGDIFFNLRYSATVLDKRYYGSYLLLFLHVSTIMLIIYRKYWNVSFRLIFFLSFIWGVSFTFTLARTEMLLCMIAISGSWYLSQKYIYKSKTNYKPFILMGILFLAGFFVVATVTNKVRGNLVNTFMVYLGYPIISFDKYIVDNPSVGNGSIVLYPLIKILSIIYKNLNFSTPGGILIPPGVPNVFSAIQGPYIDFGKYGVVFVFFLLGIVYRIIYAQVRKGNIWFMIYYCFILFPLVMSFFEYTFSFGHVFF